MRNLVLFIHGGSSIDAASADSLRRAFAEVGYNFDDFSVSDPQVEPRLKTIVRERGDEILFFYSSNFWALNIRNGDTLLHAITGIPLVVLLHDHPIYFLQYASPDLDGIIMHVPGEDLVDFVGKHFNEAAQIISNPGYWPHTGVYEEPVFDDFLKRKNMLFFPMNLSIFGMNIDDAWTAVKELPPPRRQRAVRLIEAALTDCLTPLHVISQRLSASGDCELAVEDLRYVLNFVKMWRRNHLVRTLIDLPILVSSAYVPADLEFRHPEKFMLLSVPETLTLYRRFRFVANVNPLLHIFHDRVTNALCANAVCVTDQNLLIDRYFQDDCSMIFVDFVNKDMPEKIMRYLDDPERAFALTVANYEIRKQRKSFVDSCRTLIGAIEDVWERRKVAGER